ncbi:MAG: tetratricopeptide repeat-containing glycosyltransferase family 2 protein [Terriglobales bacterium]
MTLGLSMIVRDAEADLPACLASVRGWVAEIVVGDTGSRDQSRACARSLGARVLDIPWEADFARARNRVLAAMSTDWVLVLDADERLEPCPRRRWQAQMEGSADAFQVTIRNYVPSLGMHIWDLSAQPNDDAWPEAQPYPAFIEHQNVRLFRRHPQLYFVGCVHESVGPRVAPAGLRLGVAAGRIHHFGMVRPPVAIAAKNRLYRELGKRKVAQQPADAQGHFELGVIEFENFHNDGEALRCFERCLRLRPGFAQAWFFAGACLARLGHPQEALGFLEQASTRGCEAPQLAEMMADAQYNVGHFAAAVESYQRAERQGKYPALASKRGLAELRAGRRVAGLARLRGAVEAAPEEIENHDRLATALVWMEEWSGAAQALEARVQRFPADPHGYLRLGALLAQRGELERAQWWLRRGLRQLPADAALRHAWRELQQAVGHSLKPPAACADRSA